MRNVDYIQLDEDAIELMPNGFMSMLANLTRTGIFIYQQVDPDGTVKILRQLRLPEEVFSEAAMSTLAGLPLTNNHPSELISPENASDYIVGMTTDRPKRVYAPVTGGEGNDDADDKEEFIQQKLTVFDGPTIKEIQSKRKTQISLGYKCELDFTPGTYKGEQYDAVQRKIRMNHVSLVHRARGGNNCKILMDDGTEQVVNLDGFTDLTDENTKPKEQDVKVFLIDGKEYKVEDDVYALLTSLSTKLQTRENLDSEKQKEIDKLTAINDDLSSKIKVQKDSEDDSKFNARVKERVALVSKAASLLGSEENLDSLSDDEVRKKVIEKALPEVNLDGKSSDYIAARFDIVCEDAASNPKDKKKLGREIVNGDDDNDNVFEIAEKARKKAWETARTQYLGGKK